MSQLELNKGDQFIMCVDVSASMNLKDCPGNTARIEYVKEQCITITKEAAKWDPDGVDLITFGVQVKNLGAVTAEEAGDKIGPLRATEGMTDTAAVIRAAYAQHKKNGSKQTVCFIFTDGEPSDRDDVKSAIRNIANEIKDEHEFAISLLTVGQITPELQAFLTDLDDNLGATKDIVDVKKIEEVDFMAAFAGALHD